MGIHLEMYAIDRPRFDQFLDKPIGELLWLHHRTVTNPDCILRFVLQDGHDSTYWSSPRTGQVGGSLSNSDSPRQFRVLAEEDCAEIPFLQQSARTHLDGGDAFGLLFYLRGFAGCDGIEFLHEVEFMDRRWWVGSVLHYARNGISMASDYEQFELLFRRVLRSWNCDADIPDGDVVSPIDEMPIRLNDDANLRVGFWNQSESNWMSDRLCELLATDIQFSPPPGSGDHYPDLHEECDAWIRQRMSALASIRQLQYEKLNLLSVIG